MNWVLEALQVFRLALRAVSNAVQYEQGSFRTKIKKKVTKATPDKLLSIGNFLSTWCLLVGPLHQMMNFRTLYRSCGWLSLGVISLILTTNPSFLSLILLNVLSPTNLAALSRNDYFSSHLSNSPAQTILAHVWVIHNQPSITHFSQLSDRPSGTANTVNDYSPHLVKYRSTVLFAHKLLDYDEEHRMHRHAQRHLVVDYCIYFSVT